MAYTHERERRGERREIRGERRRERRERREEERREETLLEHSVNHGHRRDTGHTRDNSVNSSYRG